MDAMTTSNKKWHVSREIPLALVLVLVGNAATVVWFASQASFRLDNVEKQQMATAWQAERIIRLEEQVKNVQIGIGDIKTILQAQSATRQVQ